MIEEIHSNQEIPIEEHFKVSAGPGAGKTRWLISHIRNVLRKSTRLAKTAKIACITYTNAGVEEIQGRLRGTAERVEVTTIHSFLYRNVLKPHAFLLKNEDGKYVINLRHLNEHEEHVPSLGIINRWTRKTNQHYLDRDKLYQCLLDLDWMFNEQEELTLRPKRIWKLQAGKYPVRKGSLIEYKNLYWNSGRIHHEDVLYFAYRLVTEYPEILPFISAKYPYVFVDEFQDTHPIQTAIIKKLAKSGTVVGVIGDPAQSIYQFQGAKRQDFIDFTLPNMKQYYMKGNWRSTAKIISLLNKIRSDGLKQNCERGVDGNSVRVLIGDKLDVIKAVKAETEPIVLARRNETVGQIRNRSGRRFRDLWSIARLLDSNDQRQDLIYSTLRAVTLALSNNFQEARREVGKLFRVHENDSVVSDRKRRTYSITLIQRLIEKYDQYVDKTITEYNNEVHEYIREEFNVKLGAKITRGKYKKDFADQYKCKDLLQEIKIEDDKNRVITIHQAKGAEFKDVLVVFEEDAVKHLFEPDTESDEDESRIYYVAMSRAQNNLFLNVPALSKKQRKLVKSVGLQLQVLG